ncbi:hypothetical protein CEUSTIGMA_g4640.t1 [Chlamydomonas eustigma]|uniref:Uncharacterized protein n=1 Tax=Chlamydomonas eustigma TaxID=1157962 RepID=A0A250X270_9CHLO|nr:hypothetical protein CEUSTIGMA_g4640.t1 [Chlamydomonas eustigma]|eukprot:GAX77194.1 hypothetical protein CEUSTIGMA_g4640.t1 [Chlamydomonas eustigma]
MPGSTACNEADSCLVEKCVTGRVTAITPVVKTVDSTEIVSDASAAGAVFSPSADFLSSPELPELSFFLNELNGDELVDDWSNFSPQESLQPDWMPLSSEAAVLGEQIPAPEAVDLNLLQSLLQSLQQIVGGSINVQGVDAATIPLDQTLGLLKDLVDRQSQTLAAKQNLPSPDTSLEKLLMSLSHNTESSTSDAVITQRPVLNAKECNTSGATVRAESSCAFSTNAAQRRRSADKKTAQGRTMSKRVMDRKLKFDELESFLEAKRAQSAALERQNEKLRRRQKMLDTFIKVRDQELQIWREMLQAAKEARLESLIPGHPAFASFTLEKIRSMDVDTWRNFGKGLVWEYSRCLVVMKRAPPVVKEEPLTSSSSLMEPSFSQTVDWRTISTTLDVRQRSASSAAASVAPVADTTSASVDRSVTTSMSPTGVTIHDTPWALNDQGLDPVAQLELIGKCMNRMGKLVQFLNPKVTQGMCTALPSAPIRQELLEEVLSNCCLSDEQMQDMLMTESILSQSLTKIFQDRQQLVIKLEQQMVRWQDSPNWMTVMSMEQDQMLIFEQLRKNMHQERCQSFLAIEVFFHYILDTVQKSIILTSMYPRNPNKLILFRLFVDQIRSRSL